jgi:hypothetical protein
LSSSEGPAPSTGRHQCEELEHFTELFHLLEKFTGLRDPSGAIYTGVTLGRHLHTQQRSAWTQELDLRPYKEGF